MTNWLLCLAVDSANDRHRALRAVITVTRLDFQTKIRVLAGRRIEGGDRTEGGVALLGWVITLHRSPRGSRDTGRDRPVGGGAYLAPH
jgi:hypothetical protein